MTTIDPVRVKGIPMIVFIANYDQPEPLVIGASQDVTPETLINLFGKDAPMIAYVYNFPKEVVIFGEEGVPNYYEMVSESYSAPPHKTDKIYRRLCLAFSPSKGAILVQHITFTRIVRGDQDEVLIYQDLIMTDSLQSMVHLMFDKGYRGKFKIIDVVGDDFLIPHKDRDSYYYNHDHSISQDLTTHYHDCPDTMIFHAGEIHFLQEKEIEDNEMYISDLSEELGDMYDEMTNFKENEQPIINFSPINVLMAEF